RCDVSDLGTVGLLSDKRPVHEAGLRCISLRGGITRIWDWNSRHIRQHQEHPLGDQELPGPGGFKEIHVSSAVDFATCILGRDRNSDHTCYTFLVLHKVIWRLRYTGEAADEEFGR